ncbi:MAG: hypothetical protein J6M02_01620 [Clostridia bacterium]|nr:hypothetical protein [Clostridia bacterium]
MKRKINWVNIINKFVLFSLILSLLSVVYILIFAPTRENSGEPFQRIKSDYVLIMLQCILGIFAMALPKILKNKTNVIIPSNMMLLYAIFLYCAIYLGEVKYFYYHIPHWDTILHTFSGFMLGALGFSFILILNKTERIPVALSPSFIAVFAFCFSVSLGALWEIYEFAADGILATNMQKFAAESAVPFVGRAALADTMKDLIVDTLGALVMSILGYISLKYKKGWVEALTLKFKSKKEKQEIE